MLGRVSRGEGHASKSPTSLRLSLGSKIIENHGDNLDRDNHQSKLISTGRSAPMHHASSKESQRIARHIGVAPLPPAIAFGKAASARSYNWYQSQGDGSDLSIGGVSSDTLSASTDPLSVAVGVSRNRSSFTHQPSRRPDLSRW
ncbi:hypothetical protein F511_20242 [Dorcoceras hygrometricum]|uniref:Uncharacterized protein n=1 Tax=Dorcoceras hygrometricum TaxID=472368 RepID=A0A2Z7C0D3_9LAMI|nr:hypothetical protein F511_20242 [Dorcoceras hygrometricum]